MKSPMVVFFFNLQSCSLNVAKRVFRFVSAHLYWGMSRRKTDARVLKRRKVRSNKKLECTRKLNENLTVLSKQFSFALV